jgi:RNA polymerase sigma factor (sigma-70 family)
MESMSGELAGLPVDVSPRPGATRLFGDARLVRLAARGDRRALEAIYRRHYQELYRYCRAIVRNRHDAEDALQATMEKVAAALPGETREISLRPWLFRIAHNESISILRSRRPEAELDQERPELGADVEAQAEGRDRLRRLVRDLERLPDRQRGALIMRELNGFSFEEVGAAFSISPEAAKQSVYEARVALQEMNEGREMDCDLVRQAISDGDRRKLRARRFRAHLGECEGCADFAAAIDRRSSDLAVLAPPIGLPAALAALHAAVGAGTSGVAAGAGSATGIGAAIGGSAAVKSAVVVIAAAAIAGGGVEMGGLIDRHGGDSENAAKTAPAGSQDHVAHPNSAPGASFRAAGGARAAAPTRAGEAEAGRHQDRQGARGAKPGHHAHSQGASPPHPDSASGSGSSPPGLAQIPPGQQSSPPGQATGQGGSATPSPSVSHSNPQAQSTSSSVIHSQADTAPQRDGTTIAPGQTGTLPASPNGNAYGPEADKAIK